MARTPTRGILSGLTKRWQQTHCLLNPLPESLSFHLIRERCRSWAVTHFWQLVSRVPVRCKGKSPGILAHSVGTLLQVLGCDDNTHACTTPPGVSTNRRTCLAGVLASGQEWMGGHEAEELSLLDESDLTRSKAGRAARGRGGSRGRVSGAARERTTSGQVPQSVRRAP